MKLRQLMTVSFLAFLALLPINGQEVEVEDPGSSLAGDGVGGDLAAEGASDTEEATTPASNGSDGDDTLRTEVFAPFVSRLSVRYADPEARLSWEDVPGLDAQYLIYRSDELITVTSLSGATLIATVESGVESYTDTIDRDGTYYYAIITRTRGGQLFEVLVPFRNQQLIPLVRTIDADAAAAAAAAAAEELALVDPLNEPEPEPEPEPESEEPELVETQEPVVEEPEIVELPPALIEATAQNGVLVLGFTNFPQGPFSVYRSTKGISEDSLNDAELIWTADEPLTELQDVVIPGVPYYYAALSVSDGNQEPGTSLVLGENSLARGVVVPRGTSDVFKAYEAQDSSGVGLPFLNLPSSLLAASSRGDVPQLRIRQQPLTVEAQEAVISIVDTLYQRRAPQPPQPKALAPDPELEGQAHYELVERVVQTALLGGELTPTLEAINNLLSVPLPDEVRARARYYRAIAHILGGRHEDGILELSVIRSQFEPQATEPWLEYSLAVLAQPETFF